MPALTDRLADNLPRMRLAIRGAVQGVGFRPFVFRLARELGLAGWVSNSAQGLTIEVEGDQERLEAFLGRIEREKPPRAFIHSLEPTFLDSAGFTTFEIRRSDEGGPKTVLIVPDIATCADCLREILEPGNRRHRYPFTNCTNCGPRFSIIESLPYDRPRTTMRKFAMCEQCQAEYDDPRDRRFHAQPNACPRCGPQLELWAPAGNVLASRSDALSEAADRLRAGAIIALKGLGGFQFLVDARREEAVYRLRRLKARKAKPFAVMYPALQAVRTSCEVSDLEERLLCSPESPIVLLRRRQDVTLRVIADAIAPGNPNLGVMLPYTPLHHLLLADLDFPVVATSGNLTDEPICTDEHQALERLGSIADCFLVHDRPIARHVDDSVVRVLLGREQVLRRARGYAPLPIQLQAPLPPLLAVGAHLKNTISASVGKNIFVSQHIGDLETAEALDAFQRTVADFRQLYELRPVAIACDAHPDYSTTHYANVTRLQVIPVQHHYAHVLACMAENELNGPVLGVSWDGTGFGPDGTIWGGEFLQVTESSFRRAAHFRTFGLPGGENAIREPRRAALGLLYELLGDALFAMTDLPALQSFSPRELGILKRMLNQRINTPTTSSAGRLFDAVASLIGLCQVAEFEGQAAMELEFVVDDSWPQERYDFGILEAAAEAPGAMVVDWGPMIRGIINDAARSSSQGEIAAKFHHTLVEIIVAAARRLGEQRVVLTGGCFQNRYLTEQAVRRLRKEGFRPYWHQRLPPNDGGIAVGQVLAAARERFEEQ